MKKICIVFLTLFIIVLSGIGFLYLQPTDTQNAEYLRIHIRANSNLSVDQAVKYKVKEKVVDFITPYIAKCKDKKEAENTLINLLSEIEKVTDSVLKKEGFYYTSKAKINNEEFPTRSYENLVLEKGFYDALILQLGSGEGDNWWCVVYPPLCFVGEGSNYIYKSKLKEIIDNFFANNGGGNSR